jgi:peptide/nickel transport system substrate-binding protein
MRLSSSSKVAAVGLSVALGAAACGGSNNDNGGTAGGDGKVQGKKGGTLNILMSGDFEHLDPARAYVVDSSDFARLYARTLMTYKPVAGKEGTNVIPDLAKSKGESSDEAKTWKYTLKDGLKFQDGSPITSKDIKYGVERSFSADLPEGAPYARQYLDCKDYKGPYVDKTGTGCSAIETPDDKTIIFKLNRSVGDFDYTVAFATFSPVPKSKDTGTKYDGMPFSSGPYKFQTYQRGKSIVMVRNDQWDAKTDDVRPAYPDTIKVTMGLDPAVIDQRLIGDTGPDQTAIDLDTTVAPENLSKVLLNPAVKARSAVQFDNCNRYLALNTKKAPMDNLKVRQAINFAVNKETYRTARGGPSAGEYASTIIVPTLNGHKDFDLYKAPPQGDVAKAKQLLSEAGFPNGFSTTLKTTNKGKGVTTAVAVQAALARVGIKVNIDQVDSSVYYTEIGDTAKEPAMVFAGWCPDWPSASTVLPVLFDGRNIQPQGNNNYSQYDNADVNAKFDEISKITKLDEATKAYGEVDEMIMKDAPIVPLLNGKSLILHGSKVKGAYFMEALGGVWDVVSISVA